MPRRPLDASLKSAVPDGDFQHMGGAESMMASARLCSDIDIVLHDHREQVQQHMNHWIAREELAIERLASAYGLLIDPEMGKGRDPNGHWVTEQAKETAKALRVWHDEAELRAEAKDVAEEADFADRDTRLTEATAITSNANHLMALPVSLPMTKADSTAVQAVAMSTNDCSKPADAMDDSPSIGSGASQEPTHERKSTISATMQRPSRASTRRLSLQSLVSTVSKASRAMVRIITTEQPTEIDGFEQSMMHVTYSQEVLAKKEMLRSVSRMTSMSREQEPVASEPMEHHFTSCLRQVVSSRQFDQFFAFLIVTNSVFIGIQVDHGAAQHDIDNPPPSIHVIQHTYAAFFFVELWMRLYVQRWSFFSNMDWKWNLLDLFLVVSSLVEVVLQILSGSTQAEEDFRNLSVIRIVRVIRLVRIARIVRILRFFRHLRILTYSILGTLKSLVWAMILLCLIVYVFAVVFTQACSELQPAPDADSPLKKYYGSLPRSCYTLFASMCDGISWDLAFRSLSDLGWMYSVLFLIYIAFMIFAVTNVVTGVFCQTAMESAERDEDDFIQERLRSKATYVYRLQKLFYDIDPTNYGNITLVDLEQHLEDERVRNFFAALDIDVYDAWSLYLLLDTEETGQLSIDQFVDGCLKLKGQARSIDMASMKYQNEWIMKKLSQLSRLVDSHFGVLYQRLPQPIMRQSQGIRIGSTGSLSRPASRISPSSCVEKSTTSADRAIARGRKSGVI